MKIACNVIRDLMILYEEDACTEESKSLVEQHIKGCGECREYLRQLRHTENLLIPRAEQEKTAEEADAEKILTRCFRKIRLRWAAFVTAVLMLLPLIGTAVLCVNEYRGEGITFTSVDDIYRCISFLHCIEKKDFEAAVEYVDFAKWDYRHLEEFRYMEEEDFVEYMRAKYLKKLQEFDALGMSIGNIRYEWAYRMNGGKDDWVVQISLDEIYPDGGTIKRDVTLASWEMILSSSSTSLKESPRISYIHGVLYQYMLEDPLGYQDMPFGFEVKEGEKAVIVLKEEIVSEPGIQSIKLVDMSFGEAVPLWPTRRTEVCVPGRYSLTINIYDGNSYQEVDMAQDERVEITICPLDSETGK